MEDSDGSGDDGASVSSQFAMISLTEDEFQPVLIDFGGLSFYQCEAADQRAAVADESHKTRARLLQKVMEVDAHRLRHAFGLFVSGSRHRRRRRAAVAFRTWKVLAEFQIRRRQQLMRKVIAAVHWWRNQSLGNIYNAKAAKIVRRRFFRIWVKQTQIFSAMDRVLGRGDRGRLRRFFTRWRARFRAHRFRTCQVRLRQFGLRLAMSSAFDRWRVLYVQGLHRVPQSKIIQRRAFARWRHRQAIVHAIRENERAVRERTLQRMLKKSFVRWERGRRIADSKKHRRRVNLWARVARREILFSGVQFLRSRFLIRSVFDRLKCRLVVRNNELVLNFFRVWKRFVYMQRKSRQCGSLDRSFVISRAFGRWRYCWQRNEEEREVDYVRTHVVEKWQKITVFGHWLGLAIESFRGKQIKAIRFRKYWTKQRFFVAWKHYSEIINMRATEYARRSHLSKSFAAFCVVARNVPAEKERIAAKFRVEVLMRRFFNRLRLAADQRHVQPDDGFDEVISFLNAQPMFRDAPRVSRM
jgi:hypothetical protein